MKQKIGLKRKSRAWGMEECFPFRVLPGGVSCSVCSAGFGYSSDECAERARGKQVTGTVKSTRLCSKSSSPTSELSDSSHLHLAPVSSFLKRSFVGPSYTACDTKCIKYPAPYNRMRAANEGPLAFLPHTSSSCSPLHPEPPPSLPSHPVKRPKESP